MPWQLKIDEETKQPVFQTPDKEGELPKPVYINPDGKEIALDAVGMFDKIIVMGKTEKELRGTKTRLEGQLELFTDIEDLAEWKENADKAIETVANFNDKEWMDVKKVEKLKEEMNAAHKKKLDALMESSKAKDEATEKVLSTKDRHIRKLMVSNKFATHPLFAGSNPKTTLPPEIAETFFGQHFKVAEENGELVLNAYYANGDQVISHENPGEVAGFTEAMYAIFDAYPGKDTLLRTSGSGSGGTGGTGGDAGEVDDLKTLRESYEAAKAAQNTKLMVTLKNKIFKLEQSQKAA